MDYFKKAIWGPDPKEQQRAVKRVIRKNIRECDKSLNELNSLKVKTERLIKQCVKKNETKKIRIYCKELYKINKQYERMYISKTNIESISMKVNEALNLQKISQSMAQSASIMNEINSLIHIPALRGTVMEMEKELMKSGLIDEMIGDTLDMGEDEFEEEDEEVEEEINKILQKYTVQEKPKPVVEQQQEQRARLPSIPSAANPVSAETEKQEEDRIVPEAEVDQEADDLINAMRERLKALQS
ncbi:hypothetical protein ACO0QE_001939 [Hanseniaspora vineae]